MLSFFKSIILFIRQPNIVKGFQVLFAFFLAYFAILLLHYHYYLITFPYPIIYREGAMMATTTMLLHGIKPFNFLLEPQYTNIYGLVYPLLVWPWAKLFGVGLIVHRAVTAFFILASCVIIFFVLNKKKTPLLLNFWAILSLYASLLFPLTTTPCVEPASTGLFFMLLTVFIPFLLDYSYSSIFISVICSLLAFYSKPYFLLGLPVMASYLFLFVSMKKSIFFVSWSLIGFAISAFLINYFFQSYFDDCFFIHSNGASDYCFNFILFGQVHKFSILHKSLILLLLIIFVYSAVRWLMAVKIKNINKILKTCFASFWWKGWEAPLIANQLPLELYAGICSGYVLWFYLGKHYGANLWYFFQLFSPFLVTFIAWATGRFTLWPILFSFLLISNLFSLTFDDNYQYFYKNTVGWPVIEKLVKSNERIFNSALTAPLLVQEDREVFDNGNTEAFLIGRKRAGPLGHWLKADNRIDIIQTLFVNKLQDMMKFKKFDLIMIEAGYTSNVMPASMLNYYKFVSSAMVMVPQDRKYFLITVWVPK